MPCIVSADTVVSILDLTNAPETSEQYLLVGSNEFQGIKEEGGEDAMPP